MTLAHPLDFRRPGRDVFEMNAPRSALDRLCPSTAPVGVGHG